MKVSLQLLSDDRPTHTIYPYSLAAVTIFKFLRLVTNPIISNIGSVGRVQFGVLFAILCKRFNHSNPSTTMRYLGIQNKEVSKILMNKI